MRKRGFEPSRRFYESLPLGVYEIRNISQYEEEWSKHREETAVEEKACHIRSTTKAFARSVYVRPD